MTERDAIRARLFTCIDECGETLKEVARATGTNYSYLSALRHKENFDISAHLVSTFCKNYQYNPTWILLGKGDKKLKAKEAKQLDRIEGMIDEIVLKLLEALMTPKNTMANDDLNKLIMEAKKRKN